LPRYIEILVEKSPTLTYPTCIWRLHSATHIRISSRSWHQKTRVPRLLCGVNYVILCLAILPNACDRQTDRRTETAPYLYRASIALRGKNRIAKCGVKTTKYRYKHSMSAGLVQYIHSNISTGDIHVLVCELLRHMTRRSVDVRMAPTRFGRHAAPRVIPHSS